MRDVIKAALLVSAFAHARPDVPAEFLSPLPGISTRNNDTLSEVEILELLKRQDNNDNCASGYAACINLGAPGLCCRTNQVCSRDSNDNVACCPINSACTGTINPGPIPTAAPSTTTDSFVLVSSTTSAGPTTTSQSFVQSESATGTATQGPSMVPNSFFPFPPIATTHANAAACSSAYTSCSQHAATCTSALANGLPGVTISAPNGGVTITAIASLGMQSASSICSSLSSRACSGLIVEACARYGDGVPPNAAKTLCANMYGLGAGVAVGFAGQLLQ